MNSQFSAVLLVGGRSTRMGEDKAFIALNGVPLWQRQLQVLRQLDLRELFIAGPRRDEWRHENCIIIPDVQPDAGPLAGVVAALQRCSAPLLLALAVDLPHMTARYLRELLAVCSDTCGVVPQTRGLFEPVAAVYPVSALNLAETCLSSHSYSLQTFAARCVSEELVTVKQVETADEPLFLNMNTPEDLQAVMNA